MHLFYFLQYTLAEATALLTELEKNSVSFNGDKNKSKTGNKKEWEGNINVEEDWDKEMNESC